MKTQLNKLENISSAPYKGEWAEGDSPAEFVADYLESEIGVSAKVENRTEVSVPEAEARDKELRGKQVRGKFNLIPESGSSTKVEVVSRRPEPLF